MNDKVTWSLILEKSNERGTIGDRAIKCKSNDNLS